MQFGFAKNYPRSTIFTLCVMASTFNWIGYTNRRDWMYLSLSLDSIYVRQYLDNYQGVNKTNSWPLRHSQSGHNLSQFLQQKSHQRRVCSNIVCVESWMWFRKFSEIPQMLLCSPSVITPGNPFAFPGINITRPFCYLRGKCKFWLI